MSYKTKTIPMFKGKVSKLGKRLEGKGSSLRAGTSSTQPSASGETKARADERLISSCPEGAEPSPPEVFAPRPRLTRSPVTPGWCLSEPEKEGVLGGASVVRNDTGVEGGAPLFLDPHGQTIQLGQSTPVSGVELLLDSEDTQRGVSFMETSMLAAGGSEPVQDAPRLAGELLKRTLEELNKSRNMHREIKEAVLGGLHGLYAMVLRVADSRARHLADKERERAHGERLVGMERRVYASKLEKMIETMQRSLDEVREATARAAREAETARCAAEEARAAAVARVPEEAGNLRIISQMLEEARAIRQECSSPSAAAPAPAAPPAERPDRAERAPSERPTYAHAAKHPIMVRSKNPALTGDDILGRIKSNVDVIGLGVGVNGVRKCRGAGVAITLESAREREVMETAIRALGEDLTVSEPRVRDPLLRLVGVVAELADARLLEALLRQNEPLLRAVPENERKVKVLRRIKGRNAGVNNIILQVSPGVWSALLERRVRLGYQMVAVLDQSPLVQCYRCLGFGHRVAECRAPAPSCGFCGAAHDTRACPSRGAAPHCVNCASRGATAPELAHPAYSADCPEWRRWDRIARRAVRYC